MSTFGGHPRMDEAARTLSQSAADNEAEAERALQQGDLAAAGSSLIRSLASLQRMLKDEANFGDQREQLVRRLAEGMKRLGSIYLRQSRHQEAVLIFDRALKLREKDFNAYQERTTKVPHEETPSEKLRKRSQAENLIDYSFTMSLMARAKLQHLLSIHLKYKYAKVSQEEKALFASTADELKKNLETANVLLNSSIIEEALHSYHAHLSEESSASKQGPAEIDSLRSWKANLFEQKLLCAKVENSIQRAEARLAAEEVEEAINILVNSLHDTTAVLSDYLEGLPEFTSPQMARLICHTIEARRLLLKERHKPKEIREDEGEEETGWIITNPSVRDFLEKGEILLNQATNSLRRRQQIFPELSTELEDFESLSLWEGEDHLARCLYNQGILALMKEIYLNNVVEHFHITLPEEGLEDPYQLEELAVNMISEKESSYGEEALWEAYTLRKKFYGNDVTNIQVLKCLLPLVRAYNRNEGKHEQVINLLEPVLTELQIKQDREGLERREWIAKCLNLLAEAKEHASQYEEAEKLRIRAIHILQKARGLHDYGTVQALRSLAANYIQRDHYVEGEKLLATVLKSWRLRAAQGQDMTYELMDVLHDLGTIQVDLKRPEEAEESFRLAVDLAQEGLTEVLKGCERKKLPEVNAITLINTMGWFLYTAHKFDDARPFLEKGYKALERKDRILKKLGPKIKQIYAEMPKPDDETEESDEDKPRKKERSERAQVEDLNRRQHMETIIEAIESDRKFNSRQLLNNLQVLLEIYTMKGDADKAISFVRREVKLLEELLSLEEAKKEELAESLENLAHILGQTGHDEEAGRVLQKSRALRGSEEAIS